MKQVLIQDQTPSKIIFNGVEYNNLCEFATKNKIYDKDKRKLLFKFIWNNFKQVFKNKLYNIDLADDYKKEKLRLYLQGKTQTRKTRATQIIFKNKLYVSIYNLAEELGLCKPELQRAIHTQYKNKLKTNSTLKINKKTEKLIEEKVRLKKEGLRRDDMKIKYNDFVFNTISKLAKKINVNVKCIRSFMHTHNIKAEDYQIDLNSLKYKEFREYIEKKDKQKNLIPFKDKIKTFAKENDISLYKINLLIDEKNIKSIEELKKYYQYI